ncbi:MAG: cupin domain-containing protein, partial [Proteobacteria bacterium]|nr:cupin domain-containing protein [Pseudomonadota bacterium]
MVPSVDWNKMEWQKVRDGVERKVFTSEGATLSLNR